MGRDQESSPTLPPRIKAAFDFLHHTRMVTEQVDASIPMRPLTALEKSVEAAALRVLQQYLLGEMDFAEEPPAPPARGGADDSPREPSPCTP
jgi:hypothetical protein